MSQRLKGFLILFLLFGAILTAAGIATYSEKDNYNSPVYISRDFTVSCTDTYTVSGQLTNRTNQDVCIDTLVIRLSGSNSKTTYYANVSKSNLIVPANSSVNIYQSNVKYTAGLLTNAHVSKCDINGTNYNLKYSSDGTNFSYDSKSSSTSIIMLICGACLLFISSCIFISFLIRKKAN